MIRFLKSLVPDGWKLRSKMRLHHGRWRLATPDRMFLEDTVVPWFTVREDVRTVLDIGVDWYTRSYPALFQKQDYWTIDFDPDKQRYATRQHHTASMTQLAEVFPLEKFDLVLCNGVVGWGLNDPADVASALEASAKVLRPGGWLVLGWNDREGHRVPGLLEIVSRHFSPFTHPSVGAPQHVTDTSYCHRYDFFQRP